MQSLVEPVGLVVQLSDGTQTPAKVLGSVIQIQPTGDGRIQVVADFDTQRVDDRVMRLTQDLRQTPPVIDLTQVRALFEELLPAMIRKELGKILKAGG
ncbi:MAG: hypothetical protein NVS1B6_03190 [Steroidobacteraceae bacterium]